MNLWLIFYCRHDKKHSEKEIRRNSDLSRRYFVVSLIIMFESDAFTAILLELAYRVTNHILKNYLSEFSTSSELSSRFFSTIKQLFG